MPNLQDLIAASQGGAAPQGAPPAAPNDPMMALKALLGSGTAPPPTGSAPNPMLDALATAHAGGPRAPQIPGGGMPENRGAVGTGPGPATDGDLAGMMSQIQNMRPDIPQGPSRDMMGNRDDMMPDPRQTPEPAPAYDGSQRNRYIEGETSGMTVNGEYPGMSPPGQANMGAYINAHKPMTTEEELADVSKRIGGGDPSADGNFPTAKEIKQILDEPTDSNLMMFDKKWGRGAAKEILGAHDDPNSRDALPGSDFPGDDDGDEDTYNISGSRRSKGSPLR